MGQLQHMHSKIKVLCETNMWYPGDHQKDMTRELMGQQQRIRVESRYLMKFNGGTRGAGRTT